VARDRNGKAIWQDLVSEHGFTGSYQAVKRFVPLSSAAAKMRSS
jgi:hypothetical protein